MAVARVGVTWPWPAAGLTVRRYVRVGGLRIPRMPQSDCLAGSGIVHAEVTSTKRLDGMSSESEKRCV